MRDLAERSNFWSVHHKEGCQGGTPIHVDKFTHLLQGDILEVGPGEGRQFKVARSFGKSYAIADISEAVLALALYVDVTRYHLMGYSVDLGRKFDVIHFWYVVHHLLDVERPLFFQFVARHLRPDGVVLFNIPVGNPDGELGADGMKTTPVEIETIYSELKASSLSTRAIVVS